MNRKAVSPVIAIVLLLMMTVAAAGAAYFWITSMQSSVQQSAGSQIEAITKQASTRIIAQATICEGINEVNLVGYWKHDLGEGNETYDSSGNENTGTLEPNLSYGPNWTDGKVGKALEFDGNDDWVEVPHDSSLYFGENDFTITVTFNVDLYGSDDIALFSKQKSYQNKEGVTAHFHGGSNHLRFFFFDTDHNRDYLRVDVPTNEWVTMTWVREGNTWKAYMDGSLAVSETHSEIDNVGCGFHLQLGTGDVYVAGVKYKGLIDEVRIYDRALSQAQVEYLNDTNKAMGRYVNITVYNAGTEEVPKGAWVANLKKDGTTVDSDSYSASKLPPEERITLHFYFGKMKPNKEYKIELEGTQTSTTVSC